MIPAAAAKFYKEHTAVTLCVAALFVCAAVLLFVHRKPTAAPAGKPLPSVAPAALSDEPSTSSPTPVAASGPPDEPVSLSLPSISVAGPVQKVGVGKDGAMGVPNNIHTAGWFVNSVKPGEKGLSIIDGHIALRSGDGIFQHLDNLKADDRFTLTLRSGTVQTYRIKSVRSVALSDAASVLYSQDPGILRQLNLITCTGTYDTDAKTFTSRVIVSATLAS